MSNTLDLIIECLPVADIPELILYYLIGDVSLNSLSSADFDQVFTRKYIEEGFNAERIQICSYIDPEKRFLHSFLDRPAFLEHYGYSGQGFVEWWKNGVRHRDDDLPAVIHLCGVKEWWKHGKQHRDNDLPAITSPYRKVWMKDGYLHRDYGLPAVVERTEFTKHWFINGIEVPEPNWFEKIVFKLKRFKNKFF